MDAEVEMADKEQLRILKEEGVEAWNEWRKDNPYMEINLRQANLIETNLSKGKLNEANLSGAKLSGANLSGANLSGANLSGANLRGANLSYANLSGAKLRGANLSGADLSGANLSGANLSGADFTYANLREVDLRGADLRGFYLSEAELIGGGNLRGADLREAKLGGVYLREADLREADLRRADLRGADLRGADLRGADLRGAELGGAELGGADLSGVYLQSQNLNGKNLTKTNLTNANLARLQALDTNFENATFTGACIEYWNINSETNFKNLICEYIYLKEGKQERRPASGNFAPGEFAKLVETSIETVDLIFKDGIDWKAFLTSFQDLRVEYGEQNVSIQAIEKKSDGAFVIRLNVPPDADKAEIESRAKESYTKLAVLEAENRLLLKQNASLENIVNTLASRPITVEAKAVAENQSKNVEVEMNFHDSVTGVAGKVEGNQNIYASEQKQTLAEAADEIQKLLKQLEQTNPNATIEQQQAYVDAAISPTLKERCVGALKAGGETAIEEFLDNPYVNVGKAVVKGWMEG